jgi:hypothetical protein
MHHRNKLKQLHQSIIEEKNIGPLYHILHQLHEIYSEASGISAGNLTDCSIDLPSGKAISPIGAAHCLLEIARTSKFVCGIYKAIIQLKKDFTNAPIKILYAGCGPYATLVTPLTSMFSAQEVTFDLMDINEISLKAVRKMYEELDLLSYVDNFIQADATQYKISDDEQPHLIIAETMNAALKNEPQVELMLNLIPQLREKCIFIPQKISVDAYLLDIGKETAGFLVGAEKPHRIFLKNVYSISQAHCHQHSTTTIELPENIAGNNMLNLLTEITVLATKH